MLKVRILAALAGTSDQPGEVRTVDTALARQMVAEGRAELIRSEAPETPERAVTEKTRRKREV